MLENTETSRECAILDSNEPHDKKTAIYGRLAIAIYIDYWEATWSSATAATRVPPLLFS